MDSGVATAFRSVREQHGVTIADAARSLDVDASYLQAIEDGTIEHVASEVVAKAHVRVYARYLGFDSEAVLTGSPPGNPSPDAPVIREAEPEGSVGDRQRRRIAPAARPAPERRDERVAPAPDAVSDGSAGGPSGSAPAETGEDVDEPVGVEADYEDLAPGRRRLAALALVGSMLVGLLIAFAISASNALSGAVVVVP